MKSKNTAPTVRPETLIGYIDKTPEGWVATFGTEEFPKKTEALDTPQKAIDTICGYLNQSFEGGDEIRLRCGDESAPVGYPRHVSDWFKLRLGLLAPTDSPATTSGPPQNRSGSRR